MKISIVSRTCASAENYLKQFKALAMKNYRSIYEPLLLEGDATKAKIKMKRDKNGGRRNKPICIEYFKKEAGLPGKLTLVRIKPLKLMVEGSMRGRFTPRREREREREQMSRQVNESERDEERTESKAGGGAGRTRNSTYTPVTGNPRPPVRLWVTVELYDWQKYV